MDTDQGKLFIGGISWETTEEKLKDYFQAYGEVVETVIMKDRTTGRARGFGFVVFSDPNVADRVLLDKHTIDGRVVEAKKAVPRDEQHNLVRANGSVIGPAGHSTATSTTKTKKIFVGGLGSNVTEDDFRKYFEQFGTITDVVVMYDHATQRPRGFGFITYDNEEAVDNVLMKSFHELKEKMVEVKRAVPKELSAGPVNRSPVGAGTGFTAPRPGYGPGYTSPGGYGAGNRYSPTPGGVRGGYPAYGAGYGAGYGATGGYGGVGTGYGAGAGYGYGGGYNGGGGGYGGYGGGGYGGGGGSGYGNSGGGSPGYGGGARNAWGAGPGYTGASGYGASGGGGGMSGYGGTGWGATGGGQGGQGGQGSPGYTGGGYGYGSEAGYGNYSRSGGAAGGYGGGGYGGGGAGYGSSVGGGGGNAAAGGGGYDGYAGGYQDNTWRAGSVDGYVGGSAAAGGAAGYGGMGNNVGTGGEGSGNGAAGYAGYGGGATGRQTQRGPDARFRPYPATADHSS